MTNPLTTRRTWGRWLLIAVLAAYVLFCAVAYFRWISPTLDGRSDRHIAADSATYIYMAEVVSGRRSDPLVLAALASFPNTFWVPVLIALVLKNAFLMAIADCLIFVVVIRLFSRTAPLHTGLFLSLLLLNPTTTVSLLSVNKEIIDLLAIALFCYSRTTRHKLPLLLALFLTFFNRYEVCLALLFYMAAESRLNPFRSRRWLTLIVIILALNFTIPLVGSDFVSSRFAEAEGGGVVVFLDTLETHYLFFLALIPKVLENMFGELLNVSHWGSYAVDDLANSYILLFNNLASVAVVLTLLVKKHFTWKNDWIYLAAIGSVVMALSPVVQPRYFYFCYVLFCFQAAQPGVAWVRTPRQEALAGGSA